MGRGAGRRSCLAPLHQLVLELAGGADQELEELGGEIGGQAGLGAAGEGARPHLGDPLRLHHRDSLRRLVAGVFAADLEALTEQAGDLLVERVEATAEALEATHASAPSSRPLAYAWLHSARLPSAQPASWIVQTGRPQSGEHMAELPS